MAQERQAGPMSSFFKFTEIGQVAAGFVKRHFSGDNGDAFVLAPAVLRETATGQPKTYHGAAVGLSTDMLRKVDTRADVGKFLSLQFIGTEPSKKGSPTKLFKVLELTAGEFDMMAARSTVVNDTYQPPARNARPVDSIAEDGGELEEDDSLPF